MISKLTEFRDSLNQTRKRVRLLEGVTQSEPEERGWVENSCHHRISQPSRNTLTRRGLFRNYCGYGVYGMVQRIRLRLASASLALSWEDQRDVVPVEIPVRPNRRCARPRLQSSVRSLCCGRSPGRVPCRVRNRPGHQGDGPYS